MRCAAFAFALGVGFLGACEIVNDADDGADDDESDDIVDAGTHATVECVAATQQELRDFNGEDILFPGDEPAGLERCDFRTANRVAAPACLIETAFVACDIDDADNSCRVDADCGGLGEACVCSGGVAVDDDGYDGMWSESTCVPAECRTGDDCAAGACGVMLDVCGTPVGLRCRAPSDECLSNADCVDGICSADNGSGWSCTEGVACE